MSGLLTARYRVARRDPLLCVLEGLHAIKHALRFGADILDMHADETGDWRRLAQSHAADIEPMILQQAMPLRSSAYRDLAPQAHPTGIIAIARRRLFSASEFWQAPRTGPVIILDRPAHAGNIGAVIRTAAAAGAAAVLTTGPLDPWHPTVIRGATGLHFALAVASVEEAELVDLPLIGLAADATPIDDAPLDPCGIFVLGSERRGLSQDMSHRLAERVAIAMQPGVSSLNLAASAAVLLYHLRSRPSVARFH